MRVFKRVLGGGNRRAALNFDGNLPKIQLSGVADL